MSLYRSQDLDST